MPDVTNIENDRPLNRRGRRPKARPDAISIETRLRCGVSSIEELAALAGFSEPKIRLDEQRGLVSFVKIEGCTRILGPVARRYLGYSDVGAV